MADLEPKPLTPGWRTARQAATMFASDVAGNVVGVNVLGHMDSIEKAAPLFTGTLQGLIKTAIVKPLLNPIEGLLKLSKGIEGEKEYAQRMQLSEEARADGLAKGITRWGVAEAAGWGSMFAFNQVLNKAAGVPRSHGETLKVYGMDAAIHAGAIIILGSPVVAPFSQGMKGMFSKIFKGLGHTDEKANDLSNYFVAMVLPNYIALGASIAYMHKLNTNAAKNILPHK